LNKKLRNTITYVVFLGIGILLMYMVYRKIDPTEMWAEIRRANIWLVLLSAVMGYLAIVSRGVRWLVLMEPLGYRAKTWSSIHAVAFAYFANTFVPRSGELARCGVLNQTDDIPIDKLFGTVISERVIDFVILLILVATAFFTNVKAFGDFIASAQLPNLPATSTIIIVTAIAIGAVVLLFLIFRMRIINSVIYQKIIRFLLGVADGLKAVLKMKCKWTFIFHTLFIWTMYYLMAYVIFFAMPSFGGIEWNQALLVMIAGGLGMVFPSPGGIGSFQLAAVLSLEALAFSKQMGTDYATLVWSVQTGMIIIAGAIAFILITRIKTKKAKLKHA
jgi:uncharacterized protein (TIRG00374 family)